ncbi:hypothetical protein [uncultured Sphingomonas sp.]|uniref:hypothetical protein n=2 Tax=uncultured Sphingomonas sp. TaxID=158754 RepID=UPI0025EE9FFB|nr:hypothetical protein [uncultured Sphingomonas sp.]
MSDTRTDTARDHDDRDLIEGVDSEPDAVGGTSGHAIGRAVGARDEMNMVDDPEGSERATKSDAIDAGVAEPSNRASSNDDTES